MSRHLSARARRDRSASIAVVPDSRSKRLSSKYEGEGSSQDEEGESRYPGKRCGQLSPTMLVRARSERRQSSGSIRLWTACDLEDLSADSWQRYYLRCFSITPKGNVVSRGDYLRYRRLQGRTGDDNNTTTTTENLPPADGLTVPAFAVECSEAGTSSTSNLMTSISGIEEYLVHMIGSPGVGKTALTHQFTTSEHILNAKGKCQNTESPIVTISLNGTETRLVFNEANSVKSILPLAEDSKPCAFLVVYSVTQLDSFRASTYTLCQLRKFCRQEVVIILVGNKSDLVRSRSVRFEEGHSLAVSYKVKFIETSVGINFNVDELLVGVVTHLTLLAQRRSMQSSCSPTRNRFNRCRTSLRRMFDRVLKKEDQQRDVCDVLDTTPL